MTYATAASLATHQMIAMCVTGYPAFSLVFLTLHSWFEEFDEFNDWLTNENLFTELSIVSRRQI
mgnify:CR=1 FL=1